MNPTELYIAIASVTGMEVGLYKIRNLPLGIQTLWRSTMAEIVCYHHSAKISFTSLG